MCISSDSTTWKVVVASAFFGAFFGGIANYYAAYQLDQHQQDLEQQNVALALYIDVLETSERFNESLEYLKLSTDDKRKFGDTSSYIFYDPIPYYSSNGLYFAYLTEISKFDSGLSRNLTEYYTTVIDIEYKRKYISDHYSKTFDYNNLTIEEKRRITIYNQNIPAEIIDSLNQANNLKQELNKKYNLNFALQPHSNVTIYIPHNS